MPGSGSSRGSVEHAPRDRRRRPGTCRAAAPVTRHDEQAQTVHPRLPEGLQRRYRSCARLGSRHANHAVPPHAQRRRYTSTGRPGLTRCCHGLRQPRRRGRRGHFRRPNDRVPERGHSGSERDSQGCANPLRHGRQDTLLGNEVTQVLGCRLRRIDCALRVRLFHSTSSDQNREEYEALTTYHKSAYVHFTGIDSFQGHFRIPVPFEVGFLFQKLPEMLFDTLAGLDTSDTDPITRGYLPPTAREILQTSFLLSSLPVPRPSPPPSIISAIGTFSEQRSFRTT